MASHFNAVLLIAFGGPEKPEDIRPFLQNVVRGRRVPAERLEEVARHYEQIGGKSPLNELTFQQARALEARLRGSQLPVYVGMRNWHPLVAETLREMSAAGVRNAVGLILAPQQSDASWEKYQRNVADALVEANVEIGVAYARPFFDHPLFVEAAADDVERCLSEVSDSDRDHAALIFTAHSVPLSDPFHERYADQVTTSARRVAERVRHSRWQVAYQSRSGRPEDPWLEPDVNDVLRDLARHGVSHAVIVPVGFICDHVEVLYDLDMEAARTAREAGIVMRRARTVNAHPKFIECLADLVEAVAESDPSV